VKSIDRKISEEIKHQKRGVLFFPEDFSEFGSSGAIRIALHRLVASNELKRVAQGIYVRPKISNLIGEVMPTVDEVAKAIAKRDRARIIPTGSYALNAIGLSTQVPMNFVYLTDGAARKIQLDYGIITLKKSSPKNLAAKGRLSSLVIQALKAIGKDKVEEWEENKIVELLKEEQKTDLQHDIKLAPEWIKVIMRKAL
jgi:myosin-crossreactive antigen